MASVITWIKHLGLIIGAIFAALLIKVGAVILAILGTIAAFLGGTAIVAFFLYLIGALLIAERDEEDPHDDYKQ